MYISKHYIYIYILGSSRKNKYICLLTSPLFHALQHDIINLIYLFIYIYTYIHVGLAYIHTWLTTKYRLPGLTRTYWYTSGPNRSRRRRTHVTRGPSRGLTRVRRVRGTRRARSRTWFSAKEATYTRTIRRPRARSTPPMTSAPRFRSRHLVGD